MEDALHHNWAIVFMIFPGQIQLYICIGPYFYLYLYLYLYIFVESDILLDLEDTLNLNRAIVRQGGKPDCTPSAHTLLGAKNLKKKVLLLLDV